MVEDEHHFLFECKILQHLRGDCDIPRFENLSKEIRMKNLLSEIEYNVCKYVADGMELRKFLASHPRHLD